MRGDDVGYPDRGAAGGSVHGGSTEFGRHWQTHGKRRSPPWSLPRRAVQAGRARRTYPPPFAYTGGAQRAMEFLSSYPDDDGAAPSAAPLAPSLLSTTHAPAPSSSGPSLASLALMHAPAPASAPPVASGGPRINRTLIATHAESALDASSFDAQFNSFGSRGVCADPSGASALVRARPTATSGAAGGAGGTRVKRARERNDDASSAAFLGPWAGWTGESERAQSSLETGSLTLAQRLVRVGQGLNPDGPGKLEGEALADAERSLKAEAAAAEAAGAGAAGAGAKKAIITGVSLGASAPVAAGGAATASRGEGAGAGAGAGAVAGDMAAASAAAWAEETRGAPSIAECSSTFHGGGAVDYQGRPWTAPPKGAEGRGVRLQVACWSCILREMFTPLHLPSAPPSPPPTQDGGDHACYIPKRISRTLSGHTKGVQSVEFSPSTGHLLLSASLDGKAKVWDASGAFKFGVKRTYHGHSGGVRSARFNADGSVFATASFDKTVKVWDTETGAVRGALNAKGTAFCVAWAPADDPNVLLVGTWRKVLQWDLRVSSAATAATAVDSAGSPNVMDYDRHYAAVNTINFFDGGRRFASASDDKRILIWDYGTPVPVKELQDPTMNAIAAVRVATQCLSRARMHHATHPSPPPRQCSRRRTPVAASSLGRAWTIRSSRTPSVTASAAPKIRHSKAT